MQVSQHNFDSDTVALMGLACDEAWQELRRTPSANEHAHFLIATRVMRAVASGERNPQRLKEIALEGVDDWATVEA